MSQGVCLCMSRQQSVFGEGGEGGGVSYDLYSSPTQIKKIPAFSL